MPDHSKCPRALCRTASIIVVIAPFLSGCGSINSWLATHTADYAPSWMGGLPEGAPPRPSDPRYAEYERSMQGKVAKDAANADTKNLDPKK